MVGKGRSLRRVVFTFDERSLVSIDELRARGVQVVEIVVRAAETGDERVLLLPKIPIECHVV